ncbi:MAG: 4Fe-4S binding protein, partial [Chloroflexota bacterium]
MAGQGFVKGMLLTLRHFVDSYVEDFRYGLKRYAPDVDNFEVRQGTQAEGVKTVQYPEEKVAMPERFRFVPFLVVQDHDDELNPSKDWCTSCGICSKVCPPQCIWIVRGDDPETGRPIPEPEAFFIDIDICMNCGFCAEFCPFDAIKMDHDYELASYDRTTNHIFDKPK